MHPTILHPLLLVLVLALLLHAPTPTSALGEVVGPDSVSLYTQAAGSAGGTHAGGGGSPPCGGRCMSA